MFFEILHVMSSEFARFQYLCQTLYTEKCIIYSNSFGTVCCYDCCLCSELKVLTYTEYSLRYDSFSETIREFPQIINFVLFKKLHSKS